MITAEVQERGNCPSRCLSSKSETVRSCVRCSWLCAKMIGITRATSESCLVVIYLHIIMQSLSTPYCTSIPSNVASTTKTATSKLTRSGTALVGLQCPSIFLTAAGGHPNVLIKVAIWLTIPKKARLRVIQQDIWNDQPSMTSKNMQVVLRTSTK